MKGIIAAAGIFSAALALGACGDDSDPASTTDTTGTSPMSDMPATTGGGEAASSAIAIKDFKFAPETLTAKVGAEITVTNNDSATHTVTARDKSFDTGNLDEGAKGTITLAKAGTFEYVCNIHDYMTGTIEVS